MNNNKIIEIPDIKELSEKFCIFTPLGLRFWDPVLNIQISDHLCVRAWLDKTGYPIKYGFRTSSGNYAFQGLPGLHDIEYPNPEGKDKSKVSKKYIVEVKDELDRFMPVVFSLDLPLSYRGLYLSEKENPFPGFYLISSPSRTAYPGLASVRGRLICESTQLPASYAVAEVEIEGRKWYGIADKEGRIAVIFPYPQFKNPIGNPQDKTINPFSLQSWQMTIRIQYSPESLVIPRGSKIPLFQTIVEQEAGVIFEKKDDSVKELSSNLTFGQEVILKTGYDPYDLRIDKTA